MGDPIEKQKAIVAGFTQGRVKWTVAHREALRTINNGQSVGQVDPDILADIHLLLEVLVTGLNKQNPS